MQVTALCVVGALLAVVVRRGSPECALVLGIAAAVAVLVFLAQGLEELMAFLAELGERSGVPETLFVPLYKTLGVYLPLITTNCAVLGVTIMNIDENYTFVQSLINAFFSGFGFALAMVLFSGVRSRVDDADEETPAMFRGVPATLVAAAIVSMSFLGFGGLGQ